jgi:hypothetical protein
MHSTDPLDTLNSLNHHDFSVENISNEAWNVDSMSDFSANHGLDLNYQDCQTHHYQTDGGLNLDYGSQPLSYTNMAEASFPSVDTNAGLNLDYGSQPLSYTNMAEASFPSVDTNAGLNLDYGSQPLSYTNMAEASFPSLDTNAGLNLDYGSQPLSYTNMAEASFPSVDTNAGLNLDYGSQDFSYTNMAEVSLPTIENPSISSLDAHAASPRSTTPDYKEAGRQADWQKFNEDMAKSLAAEGSFSRAADYQDRANDNHKKMTEILGS